MPTYNPDAIRIFKDDPSKTVENALNDVFYGADSPGRPEVNGYPDSTLSNLPFDVADYEITIPTDLGETVSIDENTDIVTAAAAVFSSGDVGKFLWDATDPSALTLIGKIATYTSTTVVELDSPYKGTDLTGATCYISSSANNNANFSPSGEFIILINTELDGEEVRIPNLRTAFGADGLQSNGTNTNYSTKNYLNTAYINLRRISVKGVKGDPDTAEIIPAVITRINGYVTGGEGGNQLFPVTENFPIWTAYKINPFGGSSLNFNKNTVYELEINDTLPYYQNFGVYTSPNFLTQGNL